MSTQTIIKDSRKSLSRMLENNPRLRKENQELDTILLNFDRILDSDILVFEPILPISDPREAGSGTTERRLMGEVRELKNTITALK
jgi:hypothetical protein